jgi:ABC-type polysaccharide/polyol phosphate transport system ATPase subunit
VKTSPFCKQCVHHIPKRSTCKKLLTQIKFIQTGKFRKKCKNFINIIIHSIDKEVSGNNNDYTAALFCYHEFMVDHRGYESVIDFAEWCRKKTMI